MADHLNIEISKDLIQPIIKAKVDHAILDAIGGQDEFIAKTMTALLNTAVDEKGNYSTSSYHKNTLVQHVIREELKKHIRASFQTWVEQHEQQLTEALNETLAKKATQKNLAGAMVKALLHAAESPKGVKLGFLLEGSVPTADTDWF